MATEFNIIKALSEEITGLVDIQTVLKGRVRAAEMKFGEAEGELNACRKLLGFAEAELSRKQDVLRSEREKQEKGE